MEVRSDGRNSNQMRPPAVEIRPLLRSDGSARFKFGNTVVVAAVFGPREPKSRAKEAFDRATLEVIVRPRVGIPGAAERELEGMLAQQLEYVVIATEYPRTQISLVLQLSSCDGSVFAAAGNAAFLALLDAGVAMRASALSVCVGIRLSDEPSENPTLLLDPTEAEEREADAVVTMSVDSSRAQIVSSLSRGAALDAVTWASCISAGSKSCKVLEAFIRMSLQKRLETFLKPN
eukprot:TRINITY_DN79754_c0_g1_i1.p1 TRINITY_DN79754_c0_g1~~TRINITY_DN79754_c0_g1_i1.p1  ORF type:complete len:233 (+),score=42.82 TRINITY_DN79754_c0_g1_i1:78-776(+)